MDDEIVPDAHHISRICGASKLSKLTGKPTGAAFQLRDGEAYVSVNWLEFLGNLSQADAVQKVREAKAARVPPYNIGPQAKIAVMEVGALRSHVHTELRSGKEIRVLHKPDLPHDPSHSGIFDTRDEEEIIVELIAQLKMDLHPGKI